MAVLPTPARMRRFIAHIGAHKTGTSAFQAWLKAHRAEMMAAGYLVPEKSPRQGNHRNVVTALAGLNERPNAATVRTATLREFAEHPEHHVIVSAEALESLELVRPLLPALAEPLRDFETVAILCVRDQIAHFNSGFAQRRKAMLRNERDFDAYLREALENGRGDWCTKVDLYEANGWRMIVLPYNSETRARGITRTILSLPEFGDAAARLPLDEIAEHNPSMGAIGLIIMDLIQDALDPNGERETVAPAALRERVARVANERFDDRPFNGFTAEQRAEILALFAETNRRIAGRFFDTSWEAACPPQPEAPRSPRTLADLPEGVAKRVARTAARMTDYARELGGFERRAQAEQPAEH